MAPELVTRPLSPIGERGYAHPEVLVSTQWVENHLDDPGVRIIESDEDVLLYDTGHVPGAAKLDWHADLNDSLVRDYVHHEQLQSILRSLGVDQGNTIVLYGDKNNWWATYAFWVLRLFGIEELRIMDGGRARWEEERRPLTRDPSTFFAGGIRVGSRDDSRIRAFRGDVLRHSHARKPLIDVRSPEEYKGLKLHMPEYPQEGALRGGHIPGAKNVPWGRAVDPETHAFLPAAELRAVYEGEAGLKPGDEVITYCRIGERSSHTWFVLTYLLGYERVRNYDGSWTEWGNLVRAPIEK